LPITIAIIVQISLHEPTLSHSVILLLIPQYSSGSNKQVDDRSASVMTLIISLSKHLVRITGFSVDHIHQWFVKQGRLSISSSDETISIEIDPEGAEACILTLQDALEVADVVSSHAKNVWEKSDRSAPYIQSYQEHREGVYHWQTERGALTILRSAGSREVQVHYTGKQPCELSVGQAVELIQLLQRLAQHHTSAEPMHAPLEIAESNQREARPWWRFW
jgi:hypothetical protein